MRLRLLSIIGVVSSLALLFIATTLLPGGFDWNQHFISTMLRGPTGPHRAPAVAGVLIYCLCLGVIFHQIARAPFLGKYANWVRIAGIGSAVYSAFTITPLHDVVVSISLLFFLVAIVTLLLALCRSGKTTLWITGLGCLVVLIASATSYYTGALNSLLPWGQRISFGMVTVWLVTLDWSLASGPRTKLPASAR